MSVLLTARERYREVACEPSIVNLIVIVQGVLRRWPLSDSVSHCFSHGRGSTQ